MTDRTRDPGTGTAGDRDALRARGRAARASLSPRTRERATAAVVESLAALPAVREAGRVVLTRAIGDELDLFALERRLTASGTIIALPVVRGPDLLAVDLLPGGDVRPGWRGVPEPVGEPARGSVDVVVVPALTVDRHGNRLGYGGGHFDRFLTGPADGATRVGAVFEAQVVDAVPSEPHDARLGLVVTEAGVWDAGRRLR